MATTVSPSFHRTTDPDGATRVHPDGELIVGTRERLKQVLVDALIDGARHIVLDCRTCGYIDSSGLGVLVSVSKKVRDAGGRLELDGMNEDLRTLLSLTGIASLFTIREAAR